MAESKIATDLDAAVARFEADEKLIVALQAQNASLQATIAAGATQSPEDVTSQTAAETALATAAPSDTTGALTAP